VPGSGSGGSPGPLTRCTRLPWPSANSYELRADELFLLENACKVADTVAQLEAAMQEEPLTVKGSMNQLREHPLLSEARLQRALLARLLGQLKLPDEGSLASSGYSTRSEMASHAAKVRWRVG
jgi:hypothetical protein